MKIGIIDNTCNNGYVIMRYLNDLGIYTDLLIFGPVNPKDGHADPRNDTFDNQYFEKIIETGWNEKGILFLTKKDINNYLDKYDFVIGSDWSPLLFYKIRRKLNVFMPHGTDIFNYPFYKLINLKKVTIVNWILSYFQRRGILKFVEYFLFELTNDENEKYVKYFEERSPLKRVYKTLPLVYHPQYEKDTAKEFFKMNERAKLLGQLRREGFTILFHHCSHQWVNPYHLLYHKGNNKLFIALKKYIEFNPKEKLKIVLIERGIDVIETKRLISELELDDFVLWFPLMPRREIMACLSEVDLGVGELEHSWYTYSVVIEFMAMGIPFIHNCDVDYYKKIHSTVYPCYPAKNPDEIYEHFKNYFQNRKSFQDTGLAAKNWWRVNLVEDTVNYLVDLAKKNELKKVPI